MEDKLKMSNIMLRSFHIFHLVLSFVSGLVATATTGAALKMVDKQIDEYKQNKKKSLCKYLNCNP